MRKATARDSVGPIRPGENTTDLTGCEVKSDFGRNGASATVDLHGTQLHAITERRCIAHVTGCLDEGVGGWVLTVNLDILRRTVRDETFRGLVEPADLVVADGMPLVWASRLQGTPLPERVTGSNLIHSLTAAAAERGLRIYLLGGDPGTAEEAARILAERNPGLVIAGHHCPPFGFEADEDQMRFIRDDLVGTRPDIVYVALGSPKQERLIRQVRELLPGAWWLGIGISFSFVTGRVRRAPKWLQRLGLEWVHRLCQEPGRLARRYLVDGLPFAGRLLAASLWRRIRGFGRSARVDTAPSAGEGRAGGGPGHS